MIQDLKDKEYNKFEELLIDKYNIVLKIDEQHYNLLYQILVNYFHIFAPYLLYHFNDIKIKGESKKVKKIQEISIRQIISIIEDYLVCLKRVI